MAKSKIAFIFAGQGSQYVGMGKELAEAYPVARQTFEEADDLLETRLSRTVFEGPEDVLVQTHNSQTGIFVTSVATLRVLQQLFPDIEPWACAGLSLGEYTALMAGGYLDFADCLSLVSYRGQYMQEACEETDGTMAVVMGLAAEVVEEMVRDLALPNELWAANFNCPGQVVISGTHKGVEAGTSAALEHGAKRVTPLQVAGAFHSGLMRSAAERLRPHVLETPLKQGSSRLVMNVPGDFVEDLEVLRKNLVEQVTAPVRWEQGVRALQKEGAELFVGMGPAKSLTGMNKRIGVVAPTVSVEKVADIAKLEESLGLAVGR